MIKEEAYSSTLLKAEEVKLETDFQENIFVKIQINKNEHLLIGLIYRSPTENNMPNHEPLRALIQNAANTIFTHHLLMGDLNYPSIDWETLYVRYEESESNKFVECLEVQCVIH